MRINTEKITPEFCKGKTLLFYPQTEEEAAFIQRRIFALGFKWSANRVEVQETAGCVQKGMVLEDTTLYFNPTSENREKGFLCTSAQFDEVFVSFEQKVLEQFNKLSARIEEITQRVDAIYKELQPAKLDKQVLKKPVPDQAP